MWGKAFEGRIVKNTDPDHVMQAWRIIKLLDATKESRRHVVVDLGSGFGGMAEKLAMLASRPLDIVLVDIPLNLANAYVFLERIFGPAAVNLVATEAELDQVAATELDQVAATRPDGTRFILAPTLLAHRIPAAFDITLCSNNASFSEMDVVTVNYYIDVLFNKSNNFIVETNSNMPSVNSSNHREVESSRFVFSDDFVSLIKFPHPFIDRYVTSIYERR